MNARIVDSTIEAIAVTKSFDGEKAISNVNLTLSSKEIVALAGGNGSGKSTLLKILAGVLKPDAGRVVFNGVTLEPGNVRQAGSRGLAIVFQDCSLCPEADVVENMFLGNEMRSPFGFLKRSKMKMKAQELVAQYQLPIPNRAARVGEMSAGERKAVAIARALTSAPTFLLLDEPTSELGVKEQSILLRTFTELHAKGVGIFICTHSPDDILSIAARVLILRSGELVADQPTRTLAKADLVLLMTS